MDNPWSNAWHSSSSPWNNNNNNSTTVNRDDEADLAAPSWNSAAPLAWPEPDPTSVPIWSSAPLPDHTWNHTSPYDSFPLTNSSTTATAPPPPATLEPEPEPELEAEPKVEEKQDVDDDDALAHEPKSPPSPPQLTIHVPEHEHEQDEEEEQEHKASTTVSPSPSAHTCPSSPVTPSSPGSPDAFGGFETGVLHEETSSTVAVDAWNPGVSGFDSGWSETPAWDSEGDSAQSDASPEPVDEWEAARIQKERQDRVVPPERLQAILSDFNALSTELHSVPQDSQSNNSGWRAGVDAVPGMEELTARFVPNDLYLTPMKPFGQTFTAKGMAEAVKLTRNTPFTRFSPLAQYVATKGSTAWEISVKSRPEAITDDTDVIPVGWRILEKKEDAAAVVEQDTAKRSTGGLLSFFSKRSSMQPTPRPRSESPLPTPQRNSTPISISQTPIVVSPRSSADVLPIQIAAASSTGTTTTSSPVSATPSTATPAAMSNTHSTSSSVDIFPRAPESADDEPVPPTPSAVSRFFKSFSRAKGRHVTRESTVALSTGDIEFLEDIVPSATDDEDGADADDHQLKSLQSMIVSAPIPNKLPPPLAPPPRPKPPPPRASPVRAPSPAPQQPQPAAPSLFDLQPISPVNVAKIPSPLTLHPPTTAPVPLMSIFDDPVTTPTPAHAPPPPSIAPAPSLSRPPSTYDFDDDMSIFNMPLSGSSKPKPQTLSRHPEKPHPAKRTSIKAVMSSSSASSSSSSLFALPPPPGGLPQPQQNKMSRIPSLPPPPPSSSPLPRTVSSPPPAQPVKSLFDDDDGDFAGFQSSSQHVSQSSIATTATSSSSTNQLISSAHKTSSSIAFDDFDDFVDASTMNDGSTSLGVIAPAPPVKFSRPISPPAPSRSPAPPPKDSPLHKRTGSRVYASEHKRTQSLLDVAAEKNGHWLGPPTPVPEAIPPPPGGQSIKKKTGGGGAGFLSFGDDNDDDDDRPLGQFGMQQQKTAMKSTPAAPSGFGGFTFPAAPPSRPPSVAPTTLKMDNGPKQGKSGLSAQDLSFFEGL